jgi:urease accessory protein
VRALQFGDSVLPVGAFSFSNGLEAAVQLGMVRDLETLRGFVTTAVEQSATSDGVGVLHAFRAAAIGDMPRVLLVDQAVHHRKLNEEMRLMTVRMGRKLAEMATHVTPAPHVTQWLAAIQDGSAPGTYPVGQALVFSSLGLAEHDAFGVSQYGLASMMLGAALRLMRINYLDVQQLLFELNGRVDAAYQRVREWELADMAAFSPLFDIAAAAHVKAHVRMFMN